jgi:hypothetical protein
MMSTNTISQISRYGIAYLVHTRTQPNSPISVVFRQALKKSLVQCWYSKMYIVKNPYNPALKWTSVTNRVGWSARVGLKQMLVRAIWMPALDGGADIKASQNLSAQLALWCPFQPFEVLESERSKWRYDCEVRARCYSAVVGSIILLTSDTLLAGMPACRACSRTRASLGAMYSQYTLSSVTKLLTH